MTEACTILYFKAKVIPPPTFKVKADWSVPIKVFNVPERLDSFLLSVAMVGTSSFVKCDSCDGALVKASKTRINKLSLRKFPKDTVKLCVCTQPSGDSSSSSAKVCEASPKASAKAKAKIVSNIVVASACPTYEIISDDDADHVRVSQGKNKMLRNLLTGQKRKSQPKNFNLEKHVELFANNPETSKQTEEIRIEIANVSKFDSKYLNMSTQKFVDALKCDEPKSKIIKLNSQSPGCLQTDETLFEESFDFDDVDVDTKAFGDDAAREVESISDELGIKIVSSSRRPTSRASLLATPPLVAPPTNMPLLDDNVPVAPFGSRQASPLSDRAAVTLSAPGAPVASETAKDAADELVVTPVLPIAPCVKSSADEMVNTQVSIVPSVSLAVGIGASTTSSAHDDDDDDDDAVVVLTQDRVNTHCTFIKKIEAEAEAIRARLAEVENNLQGVRVANHVVAALHEQYHNIDRQQEALRNTMACKIAHTAGGHSSRVLDELCMLERQVVELSERKIRVLQEIKAKGKLIWQIVKK